MRILRGLSSRFSRLNKAISRDWAALTPLKAVEGIGILLIVTQLLIFSINTVNHDRPVLGLRLEGQAVSRLSGEDFRRQADATIRQYENKSITVKAADETSFINLRQLGVKVDEQQVYDRLLSAGRSGGMFKRFAEQDLAALGIENLAIGHPNFNDELARTYIATLNKRVESPPTNAYFTVENQKAIIFPDKEGVTIDADAATSVLRETNPMRSGEVELPTKQVAAKVTRSILEPLLPQVQSIADKPLTITAGESKVTLSPEQLVELIVPKVTPDPKDGDKLTAQLSFNETKLNAIVDGVIKKAVVAPEPTILSGSTVVRQGKPGVRTADTHVVANVLAALLERQTGAASPTAVNIPLVAVEPPVVQQVANDPRSRTGTGLVRLTFDDGPGAYTEQVLDILKRYNVHATFYVLGVNAQRYPHTMQRIKNEGHAIGNHSFSHANLTHLSWEGIRQELASTQSVIQQTCGVTPTGFRPPYGAHNQRVREVAASLGLSVDMWSVDTRDWAQPGSSVITHRVLSGTGPGAVILLHTLYQQTVNALPSIIEGIRAQGYTLE